MKFSQFGRFTLAAVALTAMSLTISACSVGHTLDYLYVTTAGSGTVYVYNVDNDSGALTPNSTFSSGGTTPVAEVVSPNAKYLYIANQGSNNIAQFTINSDGSLTAGSVVKLPGTGTTPTFLATDPEGLNLLVSYTNGYNATGTSPVIVNGGVAVYPISATSGSLGTGVANAVGHNPLGLNVTDFVQSNHIYYTYVVDQADARVLAFQFNATTGALTALSPASVTAGVSPTAVTSGPTAQYVYVTDAASNQLIGYVIQPNGTLVPMINGPFGAGTYPNSATIDPRGLFLYVTNYDSSTVGAYAISQTTGEPSGIPASVSFAVGTYPVAICIEPALGIYVFTANSIDNSISSLQLNNHTGALTDNQNTPFNTGKGPSAVVAVAAGNHATQIVQP
jgi:6-phosphogluconolactonase (cycloisomerase 2 family)